MSDKKDTPDEGWQAEKMHGQRVYHYIVETFALCRGLGFYTGELMAWTGNPKSSEDCSKCYKLAAKRHAKEQKI